MWVGRGWFFDEGVGGYGFCWFCVRVWGFILFYGFVWWVGGLWGGKDVGGWELFLVCFVLCLGIGRVVL